MLLFAHGKIMLPIVYSADDITSCVTCLEGQWLQEVNAINDDHTK